jgi:hypothetical protein
MPLPCVLPLYSFLAAENLKDNLRVIESRMLRRIFGPKRDGVTGDWRKLHNEELNDLYPHQILCG